MGRTKHHAIVVCSWNRMGIVAAHAYAEATGAVVTPVSELPTNGLASFAVLPDGSQDGWASSDRGDERRESILAYLDQLGSMEYAEVAFGDEAAAVTADHRRAPAPIVIVFDHLPTLAYTIGNEAGYDAAMESKWPVPILKTGCGDQPRHRLYSGDAPPPDYMGGSVWPTIEAAREVAKRGVTLLDVGARVPAAVYEVALPGPFDECTHEIDGLTYLVDDAVVLRKIPESPE